MGDAAGEAETAGEAEGLGAEERSSKGMEEQLLKPNPKLSPRLRVNFAVLCFNIIVTVKPYWVDQR